MELRLLPIPVVPDGGVNNVTVGCSVSASQICALASKCTRVHTTSASLQSILGTRIQLRQDLSLEFGLSVEVTRNKFVGRVSCVRPLAFALSEHAHKRRGCVHSAGCLKRKLALSDQAQLRFTILELAALPNYSRACGR